MTESAPRPILHGSNISPYVRNDATVEGVVTAVFTELEGFWIQAIEKDGDPSPAQSNAAAFLMIFPVEVRGRESRTTTL